MEQMRKIQKEEQLEHWKVKMSREGCSQFQRLVVVGSPRPVTVPPSPLGLSPRLPGLLSTLLPSPKPGPVDTWDPRP